MAELSKNQIEYINKISKAELERKNGNVDLAIEMLNELWEGIPEPKYEYRESFLVAWSMIETAIGMKNIELMREWIQHVFKADPTRYDSGDRELWAGQVEYECENFEKSYEYFDVAKKKSSGRCFRMCDSKYKEFYLNYKKQEAVKITELSDEIYEQIEEYSEKGNQLADAGQLEQAIQVWTEGLNLIPEPQQYYGEAVWFLASIGDMYFQLEQYDKACECFDKAKGNMSGGGRHFFAR